MPSCPWDCVENPSHIIIIIIIIKTLSSSWWARYVQEPHHLRKYWKPWARQEICYLWANNSITLYCTNSITLYCIWRYYLVLYLTVLPCIVPMALPCCVHFQNHSCCLLCSQAWGRIWSWCNAFKYGDMHWTMVLRIWRWCFAFFHSVTQLLWESCIWPWVYAAVDKLMTCRYLKRNRVLECPQCKNGITKMDGGCNHIM